MTLSTCPFRNNQKQWSLSPLATHSYLVCNKFEISLPKLFSPSVYWKRPPGRPRMTWMKTVQNDLDSHRLSWTDAVDLAQNRPLWRLLATGGSTHSQWCKPEKKKQHFYNWMITYKNVTLHNWASTSNMVKGWMTGRSMLDSWTGYFYWFTF